MKRTLKALAILTPALFIASCGVNNSSNIDFDPAKIRYTVDPRTGLCFAYTASRVSGSVETTGLGVTHVPCTDEVWGLIPLHERNAAARLRQRPTPN